MELPRAERSSEPATPAAFSAASKRKRSLVLCRRRNAYSSNNTASGSYFWANAAVLYTS